MKSTNRIGLIAMRIVLDILKGAAAAAAGLVGLILGSMIAKLVGLPTPVVPAYIDNAVLFPLLFLSLIPVAIVLGECYRLLPFKFWQRAAALFLSSYILYTLANMLDAFLYSPLPHMETNLFSAIFQALLIALVIAGLWRPAPGTALLKNWIEFFKVRSIPGLLWRFVAAWFCYPPIYYLIGLLVVPFTKSYYEDPSHSLGLVLPPLWALLLMQIPRGLVFLLAVLPLLFHWPGSRLSLWLWTGAVIFIQITCTTTFQAYWLPPIVRIPHTLELLTDSFLQAGFYVLLLVPAAKTLARKAPGPVGAPSAD